MKAPTMNDTTTPTKKKNQPPTRNRTTKRTNNRNRKNNNGRNNHNNNKKPGVLSGQKLSRALSWALRHAALDIGLTIRPDGYVPVREILASDHPKLRGATLEGIREVVASSDKQRFKLAERPRHLYGDSGATAATATTERGSSSPAATASAQQAAAGEESTGEPPSPAPEETILCIRANQGHSLDIIDPELLLERLSPGELLSLPCIVHGTYPDAWDSIRRSGGLRRMARTHIHFASGLPTDDRVVSGMRKNCGVYIYLDASRCAADGDLAFYASDNGVILTSGVGGNGVLPISYFSHVTDSAGTILLDQRSGTGPN